MPRRFAWASLPDNDLLRLRLKDLKVTVEGTWLEGCLEDLYDELAQRGLRIRPHAWMSNEWFSPDDTPGIAIPFYLAHPRLMRLERKMMIDVEGSTVPECMRILRHEAGHVVQASYRLQRRRRWQELFGPSSTRYPQYYRPNPASRRYVYHLPLWYAQSHPDEDFAETFAVWLAAALELAQALCRMAGPEEAGVCRRADGRDRHREAGRSRADCVSIRSAGSPRRWRSTTRRSAPITPSIIRRSTIRTFAASSPTIRNIAARRRLPRFSGATAPGFGQIVSKWTGEYELTLDAVFDDMIRRCRELKLRAVGSERQLRMEFIVLLTAKTVHSLYSPSRRQWLAL